MEGGIGHRTAAGQRTVDLPSTRVNHSAQVYVSHRGVVGRRDQAVSSALDCIVELAQYAAEEVVAA